MAKKAPAERKTATRRAEQGRDGKTLGQRLREAMAAHVPPLTESLLLDLCNQIAKDAVSQQLVNQILNNKNSRSAVTPILAEACGVRAVWLQFGFGPMRNAAPGGRGHMTARDHADKAFMEAFRELRSAIAMETSSARPRPRRASC
jgi:hypothetical protein